MKPGRLARVTVAFAAGWLIAATQHPLVTLVLAMAVCAPDLARWSRATPSPHRGETDA
ncbi:MAG: hypothetical protein K2X46_06880 [Roseomonas sp.]|nr:hypothetical protein [Roseomonas sp.]